MVKSVYEQEIIECSSLTDLNRKQIKVGTKPRKCELCALGKFIKTFNN